jgi:hypothetical protein
VAVQGRRIGAIAQCDVDAAAKVGRHNGAFLADVQHPLTPPERGEVSGLEHDIVPRHCLRAGADERIVSGEQEPAVVIRSTSSMIVRPSSKSVLQSRTEAPAFSSISSTCPATPVELLHCDQSISDRRQ